MEIKTNHVWRDTITWHELTPKERREFDYLDTDGARAGAEFVRYKNWVYDISEFTAICPPVAPHAQRPGWEKWDGYHSDSCFSGILIKWPDEQRPYQVLCATYFC